MMSIFYGKVILILNCLFKCSLVNSVIRFNEVDLHVNWIKLFKMDFFARTLPIAFKYHFGKSELDLNLPVIMESMNYTFVIYNKRIELKYMKASFFILGRPDKTNIAEDVDIVNRFWHRETKVVFWFNQSIQLTLEDFIFSLSKRYYITTVLVVSYADDMQYIKMAGTNNILSYNTTLREYKVDKATLSKAILHIIHHWQKIYYDFGGVTLRVKAHPKYLMLQNTDSGLIGVDASALYMLSQALNFKVKIVLGLKNHFGNKFPNKSLTASIADLMEGKIDLNINRHVMFPGHGVVMMPPLDNENFCFILPYFRGQYQITSLLHIFTPSAWSMFWLTLLLSSLVWRLFNQFAKADDCPEMSILQSLLSNKVFVVKRLFQRVFVFSWLTFVLVLATALKVIMLKHLLMPLWVDEIANLEQLLASNLKIKNRIGIFQIAAPNSTLEKLLNRSVISHLVESDEEFRASAYFTSKYFRMFLNTAFGDDDHYYTIPDCISDLYVSYMVSARSPYYSGLLNHVMYLQQHGFYFKWFREFNNKSSLIREGDDSFYFANSTKDEINRTLTLKDLMLAFYLLILGMFVSVLECFREIWAYKMSVEETIITPFVK